MQSYSTIASERSYYDVNGQYHLPNDSSEHQRLDAQSKSIIAAMGGKPFNAPFITPPKKIIDIGCGTGTMTYLLASVYPSAQVIGVDLSAVPENPSYPRPANLEFVQGDIHELIGSDARFEIGTFDYVFERLLILGMVDWPGHLKAMSTLLKPGGWLEAQEVDMLMRKADERIIADEWWHKKLFWEDARANGLDPEIGPKLKGYMIAVGLVDVGEKVVGFPAISLKERPELDGLGDNIVLIYLILMNKVSTPRRSVEELARMEGDLRAMFKQYGIEENHLNFHVVFGQKV